MTDPVDALTVLSHYDDATDAFEYTASVAGPNRTTAIYRFTEADPAYRHYSDLITTLEDA